MHNKNNKEKLYEKKNKKITITFGSMVAYINDSISSGWLINQSRWCIPCTGLVFSRIKGKIRTHLEGLLKGEELNEVKNFEFK